MVLSHTFSWSSVFLHSSPKFGEHFYDCYFELFLSGKLLISFIFFPWGLIFFHLEILLSLHSVWHSGFVFINFPAGSDGKESACNAGDPGLIPGSGRSPGERNSYPRQFSGLESSMDCIVHWVTKSRTQLNDFHYLGSKSAQHSSRYPSLTQVTVLGRISPKFYIFASPTCLYVVHPFSVVRKLFNQTSLLL